MAVVIADRVKVRSFTNGLGTLTLGPAVPGFQTFEVIGNGNETYYSITSNANEWEVGRGTYTKVGPVETLSRDTIIGSSNNNLKVNFTGGGKNVFCTLPSSVAQSFITGAASDSFKTIAVTGQSDVVADSSTDTLTLAAGTGIDITTNAGTDTITIAADTGAIEFSGSTITTNDSSGIVIDQAVNITSDLEVGGDIVPTTNLGGNLGSPAQRFKDIYLSGSTIDLGGVTISNIGGSVTIPTLSVTNLTLPVGGDILDSDGNSLLNNVTARYVAINVAGAIAGSTDGINWTEYASDLDGMSYVAVGPNKIVYVADTTGVGESSLWYADTYDTAPTEVTSVSSRSYEQIKYFSSISKFVAVGNNGDNDPALLYSSDGVTWTEVTVDPTFLSGVVGYSSATFTDIEQNSGGFFIISDSAELGGFYIANITDTLDGTTNVPMPSGISKVLWAENGLFTGWHAFDGGTWYYNSNADPATGSFSDSWGIGITVDQIFEGIIGYSVSRGETVIGDYNGTSTVMIGTGDGQILYWPAIPDGPFVSIPKPYTATITAWTTSATSEITISGPGEEDLGERFTVTGSSVAGYNGTYYIGGDNSVYTDINRTTPFDTTGLDPFTGTAILTWSHGQYIDALHYSNGIFYAGNDDEEIFSSTDGGATWTQVEALSGLPGEPDYLNDIDSYVTTEPTVNTGTITFNGNSITGNGASEIDFTFGRMSLIPNSTSSFEELGQYLDIYPTIGADAPHIHIAAGKGIITTGDLILGDDNYHIDVNHSGEIKIRAYDSDTSTTYDWQFENDGSLIFPDATIQTTAWTGVVDIARNIESENDVSIRVNLTDSTQRVWRFGEDGELTFPDGTSQSTAYPGTLLTTVAKTGSIGVPGSGNVATVVLSPTNNTNLTPGTYAGIFLGIGLGFSATYTVAGNGDISAVVTSSNSGFQVGDNGTLIGTVIGGTSPADDVTVTVDTLINVVVPTPLDLTKSINKLTEGGYTLADGTEGQIMYFVPTSGITGVSYVQIANARVTDIGGSYLPIDIVDYNWLPFDGESLAPATIAMAIFADGAWCLRGGTTD